MEQIHRIRCHQRRCPREHGSHPVPGREPSRPKRGGSSPTVQEVHDYADGLVEPAELPADTAYTYRGTNDTVLYNPGITPIHLGTSPRYHRNKQ